MAKSKSRQKLRLDFDLNPQVKPEKRAHKARKNAEVDLELDDEDNVQEPPPSAIKKPIGKQKLVPKKLRIVAGTMRGRKIQYSGDPAIRPMKERTRESVFSLLGGYLDGTLAVDLFGGTGILAIESVSRRAERGVILELSRPAVSTIVDTLKLLKLESLIEVHNVDTLRWLRSIEINTRTWPQIPWIIYACPPYRLWTEQGERLIAGLGELMAKSPEGSKLVCETEDGFELAEFLPGLNWDVRRYKPANICIATKMDQA
jgi:16S rRNA (guanine966-N2)-methyltransferase